MRKRIISLTVVLSMVLAMIPAFSLTASAESLTVSGGGTGGMGDPHQIANLDDLETFREYINGGNGSGEYFKLTAPIDMSDKYGADKGEEGGTSWTPIGAQILELGEPQEHPFQGTFDGGNFTISGVYINTLNYYSGLFGQNYGTIKNPIVSGNVANGVSAGGIVGQNRGNIKNCYYAKARYTAALQAALRDITTAAALKIAIT